MTALSAVICHSVVHRCGQHEKSPKCHVEDDAELLICGAVQNYGILGCLREQYEDLSAACKEEVFKRQAEAANDWRTDKVLNEACQVFVLSCSACVAAISQHGFVTCVMCSTSDAV